jgi:hypothetical protein
LCWAIHVDDTLLAECLKTAAQSCIHPWSVVQLQTDATAAFRG